MQGTSGAGRKVYLLGHEISYSRSPDMHNAAFRALRLDWTYELLDVSPGELAKALGGLRREDVAGANVTLPCKPGGGGSAGAPDAGAGRGAGVRTASARRERA